MGLFNTWYVVILFCGGLCLFGHFLRHEHFGHVHLSLQLQMHRGATQGVWWVEKVCVNGLDQSSTFSGRTALLH